MTDRTISIFSINDVLDALSMVPEGSAAELLEEVDVKSVSDMELIALSENYKAR